MECARTSLLEKGWSLVHQYWESSGTPSTEIIRQWKDPADWPVNLEPETVNHIKGELSLRQIKLRNGMDILQWGNKGEGTYRVKYAYLQATNLSEEDRRQDWQRIWKPGIWPKIKLSYGWFSPKKF
jgi:hypothetical protein